MNLHSLHILDLLQGLEKPEKLSVVCPEDHSSQDSWHDDHQGRQETNKMQHMVTWHQLEIDWMVSSNCNVPDTRARRMETGPAATRTGRRKLFRKTGFLSSWRVLMIRIALHRSRVVKLSLLMWQEEYATSSNSRSGIQKSWKTWEHLAFWMKNFYDRKLSQPATKISSQFSTSLENYKAGSGIDSFFSMKCQTCFLGI